MLTISIGCLASIGISQEADKAGNRREIAEIPARFFQVQDSEGYFWQASRNGALTSGETQYLQSGLNLIVGGSPFAPAEGSEIPPSADSGLIELEVSEVRESMNVVRNLWFDRERSGVRVIDTIENTSKETLSLPVEFRTTFPFAWKTLHGSNGGLLSSDPGLALAEGDGGLIIRFGPTEGRHDTLILASSEDEGQKPRLIASANRRELTTAFDLKIEPGQSISFLHWIMQRGIPELGEANAIFSAFFQNGRLVSPRVDAAQFSQFANFAGGSFPEQSAGSTQLRSLIALNSLIDRVGVHRRGGDLLWISTANQIGGKVDRDATLSIEANYLGELEVKMTDVAAIKGGGGIGRSHRVYLRDGRVLVGHIVSKAFAFLLGETGEQQTNDFDGLNLLLLATDKRDGVAPDESEYFAELGDGSVLALKADGEQEFPITTPWGTEVVTINQISEMSYVSSPAPQMRMALMDLSRISAFLTGNQITLMLADGNSVEVETTALKRIWGVGQSGLSISADTIAWFGIDEASADVPASAVLMRGNNLIEGTLAEGQFDLMVDDSEFQVSAESVAGIKRSSDSSGDSTAEFTFLLKSGEALIGTVAGAYVVVSRGDKLISIPVNDLLEYRNSES